MPFFNRYHSRANMAPPARKPAPRQRRSMAAMLAAKGISPASARRYMAAQYARLQRGQQMRWPA